jgi:hypothetical protein
MAMKRGMRVMRANVDGSDIDAEGGPRLISR